MVPLSTESVQEFGFKKKFACNVQHESLAKHNGRM